MSWESGGWCTEGATFSNLSTSEVLTPLESVRLSEIAMETLRSSTPWSPPPRCRIHSEQQVMSGWPWDICHESRWMDRHSSPYLETWKLQHWNLNAYLRLVMIFSASSLSSIASTLFCLLSVADLMFWRWAAQHCWLPGWSFAAPGALLWVLPWSERGEHHLHRGEEMGTR